MRWSVPVPPDLRNASLTAATALPPLLAQITHCDNVTEDLFKALGTKQAGESVVLDLLRSYGEGGEEGRELARSLRKLQVEVRLQGR